MREAELSTGERVGKRHLREHVPTETYARLVGGDRTAEIERIRYSALISMVCATNRRLDPRVYWINLASLDRTACGIFVLSALNPTIGGPGETCVNFVTHLRGRDRPLFRATDEELLSRYRDDFRAVFGFELEPFWTQVDPSPDVLARVRAQLPQSAGPERVVGERVLRGELSNLPVHRLHRYRARLGPGDRGGDAVATWALRTTLPLRRRAFRLGRMPRG